MSNYVKKTISPMYLHQAQNPRACHNYATDIRTSIQATDVTLCRQF